MKITADARRRHSDKTHTIYDGDCHHFFRDGSFILYAITEVLQSNLNGKYTLKISLSTEELDALRAAELANLRRAIAKLEKKVETL